MHPPAARQRSAAAVRLTAVAAALLLLLLLPPQPAAAANTWGPPTPPLPSYPCPRTSLPSTAGFRVVNVNPGYRGNQDLSDGSAARPFKTLDRAWAAALPKFEQLTQGVLFQFAAGRPRASNDALWMEGGWGTAAAPIVFAPAPGVRSGAVDLVSLDALNCTYLYFSGLSFRQRSPYGGGDVVHFASCDYVHLLDVEIRGLSGAGRMPQEALKVNQVTGMYVEDSRASVAGDNAVDFVAVQYGHVCRSQISKGNWCMYAKGGSAFLLLDSNTVSDCGEAGLRIGQGTGFQYTTPPFLNYEAYAVQATNNVVTRCFGAALGVAGGFDVVVAHNTVYDAGQRSHMVEFLFGSRSCDAGDDGDACTAHRALGGWGPDRGGEAVPVPNANVLFANNLLVNPKRRPASQFFESFLHPSQDETPAPLPFAGASVAEGLTIAGNVFVNGPLRDGSTPSWGLGACEDDPASFPGCNVASVAANNTFNPPATLGAVVFADTRTFALTAASKALLRSVWKPAALDAFPADPGNRPPHVSLTGIDPALPAGYNAYSVARDAGGLLRSPGVDLPGARL